MLGTYNGARPSLSSSFAVWSAGPVFPSGGGPHPTSLGLRSHSVNVKRESFANMWLSWIPLSTSIACNSPSP